MVIILYVLYLCLLKKISNSKYTEVKEKKNVSYLFLLLVEVINDHTNEEIEGEEGAKYDENHKVDVHVDVDLILRLVFHLKGSKILLMI